MKICLTQISEQGKIETFETTLVYSIVYGILNSDDMQIYDVEKCFDALWLEDCMLDICETLAPRARDDKLALLYEMNKKNYVAVKTAEGLTERVMIPTVVMQYGKWGPLQCSNTMDKIGKRCFENGEHLYMYKGRVGVMPLAMVDDLLGVDVGNHQWN
jgi:hypothetical protein